mgnify:CR=1 FL=1
MLRDITIGQHFPGNSVVHRCDPRLKIIATIAYIIVLFMASNPLGIALSLAAFSGRVVRFGKGGGPAYADRQQRQL